MSNKASYSSFDITGRSLRLNQPQLPPQLLQGMQRPTTRANFRPRMLPRAINPVGLLRLESRDNVNIIEEALRVVNEDDDEVLPQVSASSRTNSTQNHGGCKQ